jgi:hypothetical protein
MPSDNYQYVPLDRTTDSIRLLRLLPKRAQLDALVRCELFQIFLSEYDDFPYEALSYTWGDTQRNLKEIELDGQKILVTANLFDALQSLRLEEQARLLWIDAICIKQKDNQEKGHQVAQMRLTYKNADRVLIWLGQGTAATDWLMKRIALLDRKVFRGKRHGRAVPVEDWRVAWNELVYSVYAKDYIALYSRIHDGWKQLLDRPYFRKVWIIQEIANARRAEVICGNKVIPARPFGLMPEIVDDLETVGSLRDIVGTDNSRVVLNLMPGRSSTPNSWFNERRDLATLLAKFSNSEATDQRDRVYALLGFASDMTGKGALQPNYDLSLDEVVRRTTEFLLFQGKELTERFELSELPSIGWTMNELTKNAQFVPRRLFNMSLKTIIKNAWKFSSSGKRTVTLKFKREVVKIENLAFNILSRFPFNCSDSGDKDIGVYLHYFAANPQCFRGNLLRALVQRKDVDVNVRYKRHTNTPLTMALENENDEMVSQLLARNDTDVDAEEGNALMFAIEAGKFEHLKSMATHMAVPMDKVVERCRKALDLAKHNEKEDMVEFLANFLQEHEPPPKVDENEKDVLPESAPTVDSDAKLEQEDIADSLKNHVTSPPTVEFTDSTEQHEVLVTCPGGWDFD